MDQTIATPGPAPRFWLKSYDRSDRWSYSEFPDRAAADSCYRERMRSGAHDILQLGVWTNEGPIVLHEFRLTKEALRID
jgi:hypothetical protein